MLKLKGAIFTVNKDNKIINDETMAKDTLYSIDQLLQFYFEEEYKQTLILYKKDLEQIPIEVMKNMLAR